MASNDFASQSALSALHGWHIYVLYEDDGPYTKIGTALTVKYRLSGLQNGNPRKLLLFKVWHVSGRAAAMRIERAALARSEPKRVKGRDWVMLSHQVAAALVEKCAAEVGVNLREVDH